MNTIGLFNQTEEPIENEINTIKDLLNKVVKDENLENIEFNIIFIHDDEIRQINKTYRGKDAVTDVISFALEDDKTSQIDSKIRVLGDIYIAVERAKKQSIDYGHSFLRELAFLSIHGFLHLLGYDHMTEEDERIMFQKQEEVLSRYGIKR